MKFELIYPHDIENFRKVRNIQQVKQKLKQEAQQLKLRKIYFMISIQRNRYIYCICSQCSAMIRFKKSTSEDLFQLSSFNNKHQHSLDNNRSQMIMSYISSLPPSMPIKSKKQITCNTYKIKDTQFYYLKKRVENQSITFLEAVDRLDKLGVNMMMDPEQFQGTQIPNIFIAVTNQSKESFQIHGKNQFAALDVTYNMIKEEKIFKEESRIKFKKWGVSIFCGLNNHNRITPYAISLINSQRKQDFILLLKMFFHLVQGQPDIFITDEQKSLVSALEQMNIKTAIDSFHYMRTLSRKSKNEKLVSSLKLAMMSENSFQFQRTIKKCFEYVKQRKDNDLIEEFLKKSSQTCFSQIQGRYFCGTSLSSAFLEKLHDMIKQIVPYQIPAKNFILKIPQIFDKLEQHGKSVIYCNIPYQNVFNMKSRLKDLRGLVCNKIFLIFLRNYVRSLSTRFQQQSQNTWKMIDSPFSVTIGQGRLTCQCSFEIKSGIACEHILAVCDFIRESYQTYINKRWYVTTPLDQNNQTYPKLQTKKGRPRTSRRNILRL